jgi:hypothetical protein
LDGERTLLFLRRPKKRRRQAAQKAAWLGKFKLRVDFIFKRMTGVMGSFLTTDVPLTLFIPASNDFSCQLSNKGFGRPHSRLNSLIILRYLGIEFEERRRAKKAAYRQIFSVVAGTGW